MTKFNEKEILQRAELLSQIEPSSEATGRAMERVRETLINKAKAKEYPDTGIWQPIMNSRVTKLAAAAAIIIAAALAITFLQQSATPAYALEQTIEASRDIHTLYFEYSGSEDEPPSKECWVTFDEHGTPQNIRANLHGWGDSLIVHVWKYGQTTTWRKDENTLQVFNGGPATEMMLRLVRECDPKTALKSLYDRQAKEDVTIEIEEPPNKDEPIVVKATFLPGRYIPDKPTLPAFRDVFYVDQNTKLVTSIEVYELKDGVYEYNGAWKSFKYNEPFDAGIFDLEDEVPADVMHIDLYTGDDVNNVGLEQGAFTD